MKKILFVIIGFMALFFASPGFAQRSEPYGRRNFPVSDSPCWTKAYLEVTPEQLESLKNMQRSYYKEILALRNQQTNLRYEIHGLMAGRKPDAAMILKKQSQFSEMQKKIDEISIQYLLKARTLFSQDQLSRLPAGCGLGFIYGQEMNRGQIRGRGKR